MQVTSDQINPALYAVVDHESEKKIEVEESLGSDVMSLVAKIESTVRPSAPIQGFANYNLKEQYAFTCWLKELGKVYERFGFTPVHLRPLERLKALRGETENQKQIFGVYRTDGNFDTGLAIPFDHTVPLALLVAEELGHNKNFELPYKRYDLGLSYRGERPQVGRFRAFVQADVDIIGRNLGLSADAECLCTLIKGLESLNIGEFCVSINHLNIVKAIIKTAGIDEQFHAAVLRVIDKLDKRTPEEVTKEILEIPGITVTREQVTSLIDQFNIKLSSLDDFTFDVDYGQEANKGLEELKEVMTLLQMMGVDPKVFQFDFKMVRGLDYYTGIVFETFLTGKEQYGSISSGGRYSNLVGSFAKGLEDVEGVGGSIGLTRLYEVADKPTIGKRISTADVLVGFRTVEQRRYAFEIATLLRNNHYNVNVYAGDPIAKKLVTKIVGHGDALGASFTVIVMGNNAISVKNMYAEGGMEKEREPDLTSAEEVLNKLNSFKI